MTAIEKVINLANQELGYLEKKSNNLLDSKTANAGDKNFTKYSAYLDKISFFSSKINGYPWCASFVNWLLVSCFGADMTKKMTGQPAKSGAASCTVSVGYYKAINRYYKTPKPGDQIFFLNSKGPCHTGIVTKVDGSRIYTIEGNTSSAVGVVDNGGCVRAKSYPLNYNKIAGYGRPKYELLEEEEEMTQADFNKFMNNYLASLATQPATFEKEALDWANKEGIIQGNAQGQMMAKKFLTRGELAVVLQRLMEKTK